VKAHDNPPGSGFPPPAARLALAPPCPGVYDAPSFRKTHEPAQPLVDGPRKAKGPTYEMRP